MRELSVCSTPWRLGAQAGAQPKCEMAHVLYMRLSPCCVYGCPRPRDERRTLHSLLLNLWAVMYMYLPLACFVIGQSRRYFQHSQFILGHV
jgi:hypothetical protein